MKFKQTLFHPMFAAGLCLCGPCLIHAQEIPNADAPHFWSQDDLSGNWGGFRDHLKDDGLTLTPVYTGEVFGNPSGGVRQGVVSDGLFDVALDFDLDKMSGGAVNDMLIHADAFSIYGPNLSQSDVGNFSTISNITGYNTVRLQELWLQKSFWKKEVSLKIGNIAVDNDFFQSSTSSLFINSTFGAFNLIAGNVPNVPIYPVASPGVEVTIQPTSNFYVMAGVYGMDNTSNPATNNKYGTRFALDGGSGMLVMSETGFLLNPSPKEQELSGAYRLGSFVHTANYTTWNSQAQLANGTGSLQSAGANYGVYGVMDQQLYSRGSEAISLFVRGGVAPSNVNLVDYYVDGGFNFTGFIPGRDKDVAGIGVARSQVSEAYSAAQILQGQPPSSAETVIEATYKIQIAPWWNVQPDFQYIVTPGGAQGSKNATVLGLRTAVTF